jgi:predicted nuclease with RNAse H fold
VFSALQGRRLPAKRHPLGLQLRVDELSGDHVIDEGGDLWHRRIEELDAVACALCAHRYAVGHASWLGDPDEGVVVLPGSSVPDAFTSEGVMPPVERLRFPTIAE